MVRRLLLVSVFLFTLPALAATIHNDDSCDVATLPAATLLLPYFEVDVDDFGGDTTLLTITNVTNVDRIARITLWTDRSYPVLSFNIYLTGYDVQAINLFDVIARGLIAPDPGTGTGVTQRGTYSDQNHAIDLTGCNRLPGSLDPVYITRMQSAFRQGVIPALGALFPACNEAGGVHENATGYATIDVVRTCSPHMPTDPRYWTEDIAFDNALTGDYQQVDTRNNYAQGNPLVHIRAIPEGNTLYERRAQPANFDAGFPRTFYSRYQNASEPRFDGRQPLPSAFAARWIEGGTAFFQTSFKIWREGTTGANATCTSYQGEAELPPTETVRFDEAENAVVFRYDNVFPPVVTPQLPPTSLASSEDQNIFPRLPNGAVAGWVYLNLDNCGSGTCDEVASQNWVVTSMRAQERFSTDNDTTALGNGCSPVAPVSEVTTGGGGVIGPAPNTNP